MRSRNLKTFLAIFFLTVFVIKIGISVAPLLKVLDNKTAKITLAQMDQDGKTDKDATEKDAQKEKKSFDDYCLYTTQTVTFIALTKPTHLPEPASRPQVYHATVPTPPPNV